MPEPTATPVNVDHPPMSLSDLLAWVTKHTHRVHLLWPLLLRLPLVRERWRFARAETSTVDVALPYTLASSGLKFHLRHHSSDEDVVDKVLRRQLYRLPQPVKARLDALRRPPRVLDAGAHIGLFGVWLSGLYPGVSVTAVEPDPINATMLKRTVRSNGWLELWRVVDAALSNRRGRGRLAMGRGSISWLVDGDEPEPVIDVELLDGFALFTGCDLVKMDIEGAEWPILLDRRMATDAPDLIVLEYHKRGCPAPEPRGCVEAALRSAGFVVQHAAAGDETGVLWAWRA